MNAAPSLMYSRYLTYALYPAVMNTTPRMRVLGFCMPSQCYPSPAFHPLNNITFFGEVRNAQCHLSPANNSLGIIADKVAKVDPHLDRDMNIMVGNVNEVRILKKCTWSYNPMEV